MTNIRTNEAVVKEQEPDSSGAIDAMSLLLIFAKHKRYIIGLPLVAAVLAFGMSFLLPNVYNADTRLLPPQQSQGGAAAFLSQLGGVAAAVSGAGGIKNPNDVYIGMLKSRAIKDKIIEKYDLKVAYGTDSLETARRKLEENTLIVAGKDGLISIDVMDSNQERVAKLANSYVDELLTLTKTLAVTEASKRRLFFEQQLEISKNKLAEVEMELKRTLDTKGVISVDGNSKAIVETVGRLRALISAKEIELSSLSAFITPSNADYKRVQQSLISLRSELARLENGRPDTGTYTEKVAENPEGLQNIRLLRDVKYYQMLYELLAKQYEAARLEEAKDPAIIQVLDVAKVPERKSKPRRLNIAIFAFLGTLFFTIIVIFLRDASREISRDPLRDSQMRELKSHLRFW